MTDNPLSKESQLGRSPGGWAPCKYCDSGERQRECRCPRAVGARNRAKGKRRQRTARKALGITVPTQAAGGQEELWRGAVRVEVKSGQQVRAMTTRYLAAEAQAETARAIGDVRPFVFVAMPDGMSDGLVVFRLSKVREIARLLTGGDE